MKDGARAPWLALALLVAAALALAARGPFAERPAEVIGAYLVAGVAWLAALRSARAGRVSLALVVLGAVALRALALASDLATSDDVHRIVWEGAVLRDGASPYGFAPDAPELAQLAAARRELHAAVAHRDVAAAYPPLVQAVGAAAAGFHASTAATGFVRAVFALADLLALVPLVALLRRRGLPDGLALAWGWSPLAAFEVAGSGHLEALAIAPLLGALALGERSRSRAADAVASALFALAVLAKILPLLLLPWFARAAARPAWRVALVATFVALGCAPFLAPFSGLRGIERGVLGGVAEYALRWDGFDLVQRFVEGAFARAHPYDLAWHDPRRLARAALALAWLAWAWRTWRRERDPARAALDVFGAWLVVTPVLHPWYALWTVPWIAWRRSRAFAFLAVVAPLAFAPVAAWQRAGAWVEPAWLWPAIALPFAALLAWDRRDAHARADA